jgi:hypothetical protein
MIQLLNNLLNGFFKLCRKLSFALLIIFYVILYLPLRLWYNGNKEEWENHPSFLLFNAFMSLSRFWDKIIF